jgi:hypothetical protein
MPRYLPLRPPFDLAPTIQKFLTDNQHQEAIALYAVARGQAVFLDKVQDGAHLLVNEAFDVYTNVGNPETYPYLVCLRLALFGWPNAPVDVVAVVGLLSAKPPLGTMHSLSSIDIRDMGGGLLDDRNTR